MKRDNRVPLLVFLALFAVGAVSLTLHRPPAVVADAPPGEFSVERAMTHVQRIATQPRPIGSPANMEIRDYLFDELKEMGLEPQIQRTTTASGWRVAAVENVLARHNGTDNTRAILLVAHYDSVPMSHGAGDAGSAVAAILETLRALLTSEPLRNDVIVLFTNPEETFLHGGKAFVDEHPWAKEIGLVINIDPGGVSGPAFMHETSTGNEWLIDVMARVVPHPVATSLAYAVKKIQGDRSDEFRLFADAGIAGYNVSFFYGDTRYHTRMDRPDQLDPRSLQHLGEYALSLTRHFGNVENFDPSHDDAIYFNVLGSALVRYPVRWAVPFMLLVTVLFGATIVTGKQRGELSWSGMGKGLLVFLAANAAVSIMTLAVWNLLKQVAGVYDADLTGNVYNGVYFLASFSALALATFAALYRWSRQRISTDDLTLGALWLWFSLMVATSVLVPAVSYLFTWPLFFVLLSVGVSFVARGRENMAALVTPTLVLFAAPAIMIVVPTCYAMFMALSMDDLPILMLLVVLLMGALLPALLFIVRKSARPLVGGSVFVALAFLVAGARTGFDAEHPEPDFLLYGKNAETSEAVWATRAGRGSAPDDWVASFLSGPTVTEPLTQLYPWSSSLFLQGSAPLSELPPPRVDIVADTVDGETRLVRLHLTSQRRAPILFVASDEPVMSWSVQGKRVDSRQVMAFWNVPADGLDLEIRVENSQPGARGKSLTLVIVDQSYGLPRLTGVPVQPRPVERMAEPSGGLIFSDATLVRTVLAIN